MKAVNLKLVTIICEPLLSSEIVELARSLGATGETITEVRGTGSGNKNAGEVPHLKTKIEIIATREVAEDITVHVAHDYFDVYSLITYSTDISVIRAEKF